MARIPKLDSAGKFLAADVNAQIDARTKATMRADLPALAKELKIGGSGSGIEQVSGTVTLDSTGAPIREVYATATATVQGEPLAAGDAAVFRRLNGAWSVMVVGKDTKWRGVGTTPAPPKPSDPTVVLAPPTGVAASDVREKTATITWTASTSPEVTGYVYSLDGGSTWNYGASPLALTNLTGSTLYQVQVRATDGTNVSSVATTSFTTTAPPPVITDPLVGDGAQTLPGRVVPGTTYTWASGDVGSGTSALSLGATGLAVPAGSVGGGGKIATGSYVSATVQADYDVTTAGKNTTEAQVRVGTSGPSRIVAAVRQDGTLQYEIGRDGLKPLATGVPSTGTLALSLSGTTATAYINGAAKGTFTITEATRAEVALGVFRGGVAKNFRAEWVIAG